MSIINSNFTNNTAGDQGGAIMAEGPFNITNSIFINNTVIKSDSRGGAIVIGGNAGPGNIINSSFIENKATDTVSNGRGGAVYLWGSNISIIDSNFTNNYVGIIGGGVWNSNWHNTVINCNFIDNQANYGGVIYNDIPGNLIVSGNTMSDNVANVLGQRIYNNGTICILNLTYLKNTTYNVYNGTNVVLYAILVDDMGNTVTGQNISFFVDRVFIGNIESVEGYAEINYFVIGESGDLLPVYGSYDEIGPLFMIELNTIH